MMKIFARAKSIFQPYIDFRIYSRKTMSLESKKKTAAFVQ